MKRRRESTVIQHPIVDLWGSGCDVYRLLREGENTSCRSFTESFHLDFSVSYILSQLGCPRSHLTPGRTLKVKRAKRIFWRNFLFRATILKRKPLSKTKSDPRLQKIKSFVEWLAIQKKTEPIAYQELINLDKMWN